MVHRAPATVPALTGPSSAGELTPKRHSNKRIVAVLASVLIASIVLLVVLGWFFVVKPSLQYFPFGRSFGSLSAGVAAPSVAAARAESLHVPLGQVTEQELQSGHTGLHWIPGKVSSVPLPSDSTAEWNVSFTASNQHVTTAVQGTPQSCVFGLNVVGTADPIIGSDSLPGPGLYTAMLTSTGEPGNPLNCAAIDAPTTGWTANTAGNGFIKDGRYVGG
jgi:hypothetical protein